MVKPGALYLVKGQALGHSFDVRPCVVLQVWKNAATVVLMPSQLDLMEGGEVVIYDSDSAFQKSGLSKSSFIPNARERDIECDELERSKYLGVASGKFKRDVEARFGVVL